MDVAFDGLSDSVIGSPIGSEFSELRFSSAGVGIAHREVIFFPVKEFTTDSKRTNVRQVGIRPNPKEPHAWVRLWSKRAAQNI